MADDDQPEFDERYNWAPLVADLARRRATALAMGGPERVERQRSLGKWPVRERLDTLLDPGTFTEFGLLADHMEPSLAAKGSFAHTSQPPSSVIQICSGEDGSRPPTRFGSRPPAPRRKK